MKTGDPRWKWAAIGLALLLAGWVLATTQANDARDTATQAQEAVQTQKTDVAAASTTATTAQDTADDNAARLQRSEKIIRKQTIAYRVLYRYVRGQRGITGATGKTGKKGSPGPGVSNEQIAAQFKAFCAANDGCRGAGPSPTDIYAAAKQVCAEGGCGGGVNAGDVAAEVDKLVPGLVDQAVADYCSRDSDPCKGDTGPKGETGDRGEAGYGFDCAGNQVTPGVVPATCPGAPGGTVTETVTVPAPPPDPAPPAATP